MSSAFAVRAACLRGVEAVPVSVEVDMASGIPGITLVGMVDSAVMEARSRVRCALRASGFEVPRAHITVNLAPGDMRKQGSGFDLAIAVGILAASNQISRDGLDGALFVGELGLDGAIEAVRGEIAYQLLARDEGLALVSGPPEGRTVLAGVDRMEIGSVSAMRRPLREHALVPCGTRSERLRASALDFADVAGQELAKRALSIAACGGHGVLMVGSPGAGKTMLAKRLPSILADLGSDELQDVLRIHSVAGEDTAALLAGSRPFRAPHHSISLAGMVGGGRPVRPGEVSLAHAGVLFLDELGEFSSHTLQTLRQPMEEGLVRLVRVDGAFEFPARFQLVAASNPCPCGHLGDAGATCTCSPGQIERYRAKLGGPLADRIDMSLSIARPDPRAIFDGAEGRTSAELACDVMRGRAFASWRRARAGEKGDIESLGLDTDGEETLLALARSHALTGRGMVRLARVARTIADMAESEHAAPEHLLEAAAYRCG